MMQEEETTVIIMAKDSEPTVISDTYIISGSDEATKGLHNDMVKLNKDKEAIENQLIVVMDQNIKLKSEIGKLKYNNAYEAKMQEYINHIQEQHSKVISEKDKELDMLKKEVVYSWKKTDYVDKQKIKIFNMTKELDDVNEIIIAKNNKIIDAQNEISNLKTNAKEKDDLVASLRNQILDMQNQHYNDHKIINDMQENINVVNNNYRRVTNELSNQYIVVQQKNKQLYSLRSKLNNIDKQYVTINEYCDVKNQISSIENIMIEQKTEYEKLINKKQQQFEIINNTLTNSTQQIETIINYLKRPPTGKLVDNETFELGLSKELKGRVEISYYGYHKSTHNFNTNNVVVKFPKEGEYQLSLFINFPFAERTDQAVFIENYRLSIN